MHKWVCVSHKYVELACRDVNFHGFASRHSLETSEPDLSLASLDGIHEVDGNLYPHGRRPRGPTPPLQTTQHTVGAVLVHGLHSIQCVCNVVHI